MKKANNLDKRKKINVKDFLKAINFEPHPGQQPIIDAYISGKREIVWVAGRRAGKALDIKTPILTTSGWKTMGDLKEGDYVFGQDGKPTKVSWTSDIMYGHKCYDVKFSDGSIIKADAEHQWTVEDKSFRKNTARAKNTSCKLKTKTTEELLKDYKILRSDGDFENNYSIKTCSPIEFKEKELPIDPYVFGCWLGDGHSNGSGFTTEDKEFIELFDSRGYELRKGTSKYHYSIYNKEPVRNIRFTTRWSRKITILKQLQELGVIKNKHIPDCYKFSSIEQRLELLRGLMDTDGYCDEGRGQEYCGVNKRLCEDVYELMISLGLKPGFGEHECYLEGRYICQKYRINLTTELRIFNLKRKYERQKESTREWTKRRYIVDIKECESIPVKCIGVENENHLYLAGKNLIATHNSQTLGVIAVMESMLAGSKIWVVAPDYSLAERVFNYLLQYVSKIYPDGSYRVTSKPGMSIRFDNGSIVECKSGDNPNCFDEETEILTNNGWKYFNDLKKEDLVLVRDNGISKWQNTKRIIKQSYSGEMIKIESKSIDSVTTPNHRFLVKKSYSQKEEIVDALNLNTKDTIPSTSKWIGVEKRYFTIPSIIKKFSTYSVECEPILIDIKDWCAFMGIFLSEGSCAGSMGGMSSINSGNYQVFISQTIPENRKIIKELLEKLPFNYREKKDGFEILNKQLWSYLKQFGNKYQKYIPNEIKELQSNNLKILIDWLILGDGCIHKGQRSYHTTSERLANDFQEVLQKIGKYGIIRKRKQNNTEIKGRKINSIGYIWEVVEKNREFHSLYSSKENYISKINYSGNVYCCETDAGIIYVRRNGKPYWSGNSLLGEEVDLLIIDEAAMMSPNVYDRYLFATTAIRKGLTIFISTPNKKNWFFRKYGEVKDNEEGFVFNSPSSINPYVPPEEIERARKSLPEDVFKQEYLAQFLDTGAGVFRGFYDLIGETYDEPWGSHRYVMGADLAKVNDFTVLTVIDKQTHNVVYWERFNGLDWSLVIKKIANIANKYNKAKLIIDSTGVGNPVTEAIKREAEGLLVEEFKFHTKSKKDLIDKLSIFIENRAIRIPDEPDLLDELDCYACEMTDGGTLKYGAPKGKHDDAVTSLALAVWGLNSPDALEDADDLYKINIKNFLLDDDNEEIIHRTHK